jgi:hypothetical protein
MASMTICDVCNKPVESVYKQLALLDGQYSVHKQFDMHESCYGAFLQWMSACREKSGKYKPIEEIRSKA